MVNLSTPLRDEVFFDPQTGKITNRWADYFEEVQTAIEELEVLVIGLQAQIDFHHP